MFQVSFKSENGFSIVELSDQKTGCFAEITPDSGATLHAFGVRNKEHNVQVIEHYQSKEEFDQSLKQLGFRGCKLSPFVCRLENRTFNFGGQQYVIEEASAEKHALHGLLFYKSFEITDTVATEGSASVAMIYSYQGGDKGFPFKYDCIVTYTLLEDYRLSVKTECVNRSGGLMPIQDGWHPYFDLGKKIDDLEFEFQSLEKFVFNDELVPTGETFKYAEFSSLRPVGDLHFDNSFLLDFQECQPLCVLRNKEAGVEVQIYPTESYPILQVYTPPHRNSIAIENLSGPPNAFNLGNGFKTLEADENAVFETAYRINFI